MVAKRGSLLSRRGCLLAAVVISIVVALALGLGIGLTREKHNSGASDSPSTNTATQDNSSRSIELWHPESRLTWNYQIKEPVSSDPDQMYDVWVIDLFDNEPNTITALQYKGSRVICYFSAGSSEDWRSDAQNFSQADLGNDLAGWPGERWVNTNGTSVRDIMLSRLDLAVEKNCDGVDPDNMDAYNNDNGLDLTQADAIDYSQFLADEAHQRGLSIGLKNALEIVPEVVDTMQWSVNEQCVEYNECNALSPFIQQNKPVFHVEYPKGDVNDDRSVSMDARAKACEALGESNFSTIIKNTDLDEWIETCA
ncbi:hypothetical protein LTR64_008464 [Lithohypha guttulata]|uniref:alpha-galactosidase n=1 Tax=Lithohypha guttulata TaxID=1690604 RepID=A0AAN7PHV9_9EURO|nr:hypothetical protein LTR51_008798 [Lithohypha guttulata]KAK5080769.1 hypothetical protein LTR05_008474 [Lithohypha guttulata]